jgi:hypothetical protein
MLTASTRHTPGERAALQPMALGYAAALVAVFKFKERMAAHGWAVDAQRILSDGHYAQQQLALGHTCECAKLRQSAMQVFAIYHG